MIIGKCLSVALIELVVHLLSPTDSYTIHGHTYRRCVNCGHYIDTAGGFFPIDPTL